MEGKFTVSIPVTEEMSNESKVAATVLLGLPGLALSSGKIKRKQLDATVSTHEKGIKIHSHKKYIPDFRVEWDKIVDIKKHGLLTRELKMYLTNGDYVIFKFGPLGKLYSIISDKMCGSFDDEETNDPGWN